jgi:integrase
MSYTFKSGLADDMHAFISHKRTLGYKYKTGERYLYELDVYCCETGLDPKLSRSLVEGWIIAKESRRPSPNRCYISVIREFARFLRDGRDPDAYIVSTRFASKKFLPDPYILSENEIKLFFVACGRAISSNRSAYRPIVIPAFFMLMYCCGLRTIEARSLLVVDVHLEEGYIDILASKGHRDRRVCLGEDAKRYFTQYDKNVEAVIKGRVFFFPASENNGLTANSVANNFNIIWDAAGLRHQAGKQPRPYSFRHHFAFANINRWTKGGKNVNAMLPYLMRYMGHSSLNSTAYYIHLATDFFPVYAKMTEALESLLPEVGYEG